jgi:asparaginyl-tRNA synthetase
LEKKLTTVQPIVRIVGWVHRIRRQGKKMIFLVVRDGRAKVQVLLNKDVLTNEQKSNLLKRETSVDIEGVLRLDSRAPEGWEILCIHYEVVGASEGIDEINSESGKYNLLNYRHLVMRDDRLTNVMKMRHYVLKFIREFFDDTKCYEVTPPTITMGDCEGGSSVFKFKFYNDEASLTQSSQLYLETMIASLKRVYCILPSYRAEGSTTRRHLSEFSHIEWEGAFISFEQLLDFIESMIKHVIYQIFQNPESLKIISEINPKFIQYSQDKDMPFVRMKYTDAISFLQINKIYKDEEGQVNFEIGDDIPEAPERKMVDMIGKPVFLTHFPRKMKAFYMEPDPKESELTLSADLLVPTVGEIVGSSMRIWDMQKLLDGFKANNISPDNYKWYIDQRKYGSCPHGGFGLGLERLVLWLTGEDSVKECVMYPRYPGRCEP